jgi:hypothetical protein
MSPWWEAVDEAASSLPSGNPGNPSNSRVGERGGPSLVGPGLQAARFPWRGVNRNHRSGRVFRDRRAVHQGLWDALRRALRSRCPSRSSLGHGSLAFPAARHGLYRSCLQGADLRGPNRGVGPGLSSRGCGPSWPSSRTDDVLDTWSGWRFPGRWAASVGPPEGKVTGSAPSWASSTPTHRVTDPRIVALAPCRGLRGSLAGLLS